MGAGYMPLTKEDFDELQAFVKANLNEWLAEENQYPTLEAY